MKVPKVISRIYDDLSKLGATTVITPDIEKWFDHRYSMLNTYRSQDYQFIFSYPKHYTVIPVLKRTSAAVSGENCLLGITLTAREQINETPVISLTVEKNVYSDSVRDFGQRLIRLKQAGFAVTYRSDDHLKIVTLSLIRMNRNGEPVYSIQKCYVHLDYSYIFTLGEIEPQQMDKIPALADEIRQIISSFIFTEL